MPYNKKIAIVYKSKYGCTMKYAGWLAIKLDADLYEISDVKRWDLLKYKTIIFGSPVYNSKIYMLDYILDKYKTIKNKDILLFCVSMNLQSKKEILDYNFIDDEMKEKIRFFFLNGSINFKEISRIDEIKFRRCLNKNLSMDIVSLEKDIHINRSDKHTIKPILDYIENKYKK